MRKTSLDSVFKLAKKNKKVLFIGSDLGFNVLSEMKKKLPNNYLMEGVCEQNLIGMSAGLAMEGFVPYVNTIGTFLTRRCYEQIFLDICLHNLPVRLIGSGGGGVYAPLGPTHLAIDDIAILRVIPNMTIIAPCDAIEMEKIMMETIKHKGPIYIRLGKGGDKIIINKNTKVQIGKALEIVESKENLFITTGITTQIGLEAVKTLERESIKAGLIHLSTIKPLDKKFLKKKLIETKNIITVEEHSVIGGLGSSILEFLNENKIFNTKLIRLGIPDRFVDQYGTQESLLKFWKIDSKNLSNTMKKLIGN